MKILIDLYGDIVPNGIKLIREIPTEYETIRAIAENNPLYRFNGIIDFKKLQLIFDDISGLMKNIEINGYVRNYRSVIEEVVNNAFKYGYTDINLFIKVSKNKIYCLCENTAYSVTADELKDYLKRINILFENKDKMKEYYKEILKNGSLDSKVLGIGLINILGKTNNKILYKFTKIDDKSTLVSLITTIDIK